MRPRELAIRGCHEQGLDRDVVAAIAPAPEPNHTRVATTPSAPSSVKIARCSRGVAS